MPAIYRLFDVFAVPRRCTSITRHAAPIKLTEAMAAGCACLGSAVGDIPMLLADGRGTVVPPGDIPALATAIGHLACDLNQRRAHAIAAHTWATATLSWNTAAATDARIYTGVA